MALSDEQDGYILFLYKETKGCVNRTIKEFETKYGFSVSRYTIRSKWRDAGFKLNTHGGIRRGLNEKQFRQLYNTNDGDIVAMINEIHYIAPSLINLCHKYDLEPKNIPKNNKPRGVVNKKYLDCLVDM